MDVQHIQADIVFVFVIIVIQLGSSEVRATRHTFR